jgi:hypothetical protein
VYVYLDDEHKSCNAIFSSLLGYDTPEEWAAINKPFPEQFVEPKSRAELVTAYRQAMEHGVASSLTVAWKSKSGATVHSAVIIVPISFHGHLFALHFVTG